jgi:hypothetical protein
MPVAIVAAATLDPGATDAIRLFGLTFHSATILSTVLAGAAVVGLGLFARWRITAGVPRRAQLAWETAMSAVERRASYEMPIGCSTAEFARAGSCRWSLSVTKGAWRRFARDPVWRRRFSVRSKGPEPGVPGWRISPNKP